MSAEFEPIFTQDQINIIFARMPDEAAKHRMSLSLLGMSGEQLIQALRGGLGTAADMVEMVSAHLESSKAQLECAQLAKARVLMVADELLKELKKSGEEV